MLVHPCEVWMHACVREVAYIRRPPFFATIVERLSVLGVPFLDEPLAATFAKRLRGAEAMGCAFET